MKKLLTFIALTALFLAGCSSAPAPNQHPTMQLQPESGDTVAILHTTKGDISVLLYADDVPETVKNFTEHAKAGRYDGVPFHRVIRDFMIQTGDFENGNGTGGYSYKGPGTYLNDEVVEGYEHIRGALSMAKTQLPNTAGSQFFIVQAEEGTNWLDGVHTVFGYTYDGMDVVDEIANVVTVSQDRPAEEILIKTVEVKTF